MAEAKAKPTAKKSLLKGAPKKKTATRVPRFLDEKYTGPEPKWTGCETWDDEKISKNWWAGIHYYNYHNSCGDLVKYVSQYGTSKCNWTKQDVQAFNEVEEWRVGFTLGKICKMLMMGAPLRGDSKEFIDKEFEKILTLGHERLAAKKAAQTGNVVKLTIQDRMRERFHDIVGEIEEWYDNWDQGKEVPDMVKWMRDQNVPQQFVNQIAEVFTPRMEELLEAKGKAADEQLKEGYRHIDKAKLKHLSEFYSKLTDALETYGAVKKAVRKARVKKAPSKEKMVSKVKYCVQHKELNLVSINPVDIMGAKELWVYNIKTRKMGKYVAAADAGQLGVKGSAILGFDEKQSIAKTLRKPADQLKQFANSGKVALRTFIEDIKAVPVTLNGRLSADWVLLKTSK
jgi:hypothetical protein